MPQIRRKLTPAARRRNNPVPQRRRRGVSPTPRELAASSSNFYFQIENDWPVLVRNFTPEFLRKEIIPFINFQVNGKRDLVSYRPLQDRRENMNELQVMKDFLDSNPAPYWISNENNERVQRSFWFGPLNDLILQPIRSHDETVIHSIYFSIIQDVFPSLHWKNTDMIVLSNDGLYAKVSIIIDE